MIQSSVVVTGLSMAGMTLGAVSVSAQGHRGPPTAELGIDAAYSMSFPDSGDRLTTIEVPVGRVRAGLLVGSKVLIEVGGGVAYASQSDREASAVRGEFSVSYHLGSDARKTRPYVLAAGAGRWASRDGATAWQPLAGGAVGIKVPVSPVVQLRFEGRYDRAFESGELGAAHEARVLVGLSFLTGG